MSRAIERRLIAAERRWNPPVPAGGEIIIIREIITPGGLPGSDDDPRFATAGGVRERAPAETLAAFRARAVAAATAAGERRIIIGGLSGNDWLDDAPPEKKSSPPVPPLV